MVKIAGKVPKMKTIMVVDDEQDNLTTVKTVLEKNGYKVVTASNGDECLEKVKKQKTDLILLDIMMPGTPVREVIKRITDTKIMFFSVVRTSEAQKEQLLNQKNIVGFIQKPFNINEMLDSVKKALET